VECEYCIYKTNHVGWLRLVASLELQVSFAECSLCYRADLQKRPIILRSLLIVAAPYTDGRSLFAVYSDYILQKRPVILRRLLIVATPYDYSCRCNIHVLFCYILLYIARESKETCKRDLQKRPTKETVFRLCGTETCKREGVSSLSLSASVCVHTEAVCVRCEHI